MRENEGLKNEQFVSEKIAAKMLGISPIALRRLNATGKGPKCIFGKVVRYRIKDVKAWAKRRVVLGKNRKIGK